MNSEKLFEGIRPYDDIQTVSAMKRIVENSAVEKISNFLYPGRDHKELCEVLSTVTGVDDFQEKVMYNAIGSIVEKTTSGLSFGGLEYFRDSDGNFKNYLLLSNHRDIVLDPAFIQYILKDNHLPSTEIAVGDNLISSEFVEDLMRSNRMIKVKRQGSVKELYNASKELSEYIRMRISESASVWIAHRNGRTKDGVDATSQGILKMFRMSGPSDFIENIRDLRIMPVSISYEIEPCGIEKALETYINVSKGSYQKAKGEDLHSILKGITQPKGRVHIQFCEPITDAEIEDAASYGGNDSLRRLCEIIDTKILSGYHIWDTNIIAAGKAKENGIPQIEVDAFYSRVDADIENLNEVISWTNYHHSDIQNVNDIRNTIVNIYASPYNVVNNTK